VRAVCANAGLLEARTMPLGPADAPDAVELRNPMSDRERFLRARLLPGLVRRVEYNWAARNRNLRLFEVGTVFRRRRGDAGQGTGGLPDEWTSVAGVITGARRPRHWADGETVPDMDIWDLKHHFELAVAAAQPGATVRQAADGTGWEAVTGAGAVVGEARSLEADRPAWAGELFGFEVRLEAAPVIPAPYRPLPETPPVERDLALVLGPGVSAGAVEAVIRRAAGPLLEGLSVFDEYRGAGVQEGRRSVAWRCVFRDPARTLREAEVDAALTRVLAALEEELDARRREA
jgi:phenylalanyl-tRNA synthetase beta chain